MAPKHQNKTLSLFLNISFLILLSFYLKSSYSSTPLLTTFTHPNSTQDCTDLSRFQDSESKCAFLRSRAGCKSGGYINYLQLFYCTCGKSLLLGYTVLLVWLLILFYLLGNTAAYYFCSSLEDLSRVLKLSPTIAGVTLLSLGNGAPDVFASIVSFVRPGSGGVGLNSILGGAFFVSSVVVGVISIGVGQRGISVDKSSFIRDVCFLLLALLSLLAILLVGRINIWGAMAFTSIYFVYVFVISTTHLCRKKERVVDLLREGPLLPIFGCSSGEEGFAQLEAPLLNSATVKEEPICIEKRCVETHEKTAETSLLCFDRDEICKYGKKVLHLVELPLYLPRRLTIPVVSEERWNKVYAVFSVTLAPNLLAALWNSQGEDLGVKAKSVIYVSAALIGITLGILASLTTEKSSPPKRFLFPWLAGGFLMSVVWTYMIAEELVALLVSLGTIIGINPSVLGLTVLAWGNSLGDLIANVALAMKAGGSDGAQVAISGCYAGPMFNTLVGLGLSLIISAWRAYPSPYLVPKDPSLYQTLGFLVGGLLWALVILPKKGMKLDKFLGCGLLAIYLCFLSLSLSPLTWMDAV